MLMTWQLFCRGMCQNYCNVDDPWLLSVQSLLNFNCRRNECNRRFQTQRNSDNQGISIMLPANMYKFSSRHTVTVHAVMSLEAMVCMKKYQNTKGGSVLACQDWVVFSCVTTLVLAHHGSCFRHQYISTDFKQPFLCIFAKALKQFYVFMWDSYSPLRLVHCVLITQGTEFNIKDH